MPKVVIENPDQAELKKRGVYEWPVWTKEVSRFNWTYSGDEQCYVLEGEFTVETKEGNFNIKPGDFITFRDGLECIWDIRVPVKKHYNFP